MSVGETVKPVSLHSYPSGESFSAVPLKNYMFQLSPLPEKN
jgi:hypothetical protein